MNFPSNCYCFEKLYQTLERLFHQIIQTFRSSFNPLLSVWISDETLFLVFDILLQKLQNTLIKLCVSLSLIVFYF